jgi:transposase
MMILGVDYHPSFQQIAFFMEKAGECGERRLNHDDGEAEKWASRRRRELLELLDRMNPTIEELTAAVEEEARKRPEALRPMTHPGVGPITALAYVLIIGTPTRFACANLASDFSFCFHGKVGSS